MIVAAWYDVRILGPVWPNINPKPSGSSKNKGSRKKAHARHVIELGDVGTQTTVLNVVY